MSNMNRGVTLIDALIYSFLLSFLLAGFIRYAYETHLQDIKLIQGIQDAQSN